MSIESRLGVDPGRPERTQTAHAPQGLIRLLKKRLIDEHGLKQALTIVGEELDVDTSDFNSPQWIKEQLDRLVGALPWLSVYRLVEEHAPPPMLGSIDHYAREVNTILERSGIAYEMVDGRFRRFDSTGQALGLPQLDEVLDAMPEKFRPARDQYQLAVQALNTMPIRSKDAVRESTNALEAVLKIITGRSDDTFGKVLPPLLRDPDAGWRTALVSTLGSLWGYASQVPGARHAQYADSEVTAAEASLVVHLSGAAIVYFIDQHGG